MDHELTPAARRALVQFARRTLEAHVTNGPLPGLPPEVPLTLRGGAFVTLHAHGALRGCVGRAEGDGAIVETVRAMSVAAASEDPRFAPVQRSELPHIRLEISVLTEPVELAPGERGTVVVGRDGLIVRRGDVSGLLLPQVAIEQRWSAEQFLAATARKAGLPSTAWREPGTQVLAFSADVFGEGEGQG